jgi:hypothetical protein
MYGIEKQNSTIKSKLVLLLFFTFGITNFGFSQVGINTIMPLSTLDINGNLSIKVVNLNGGPSGSAALINDGVYISLTPTPGNNEFYVNDPTTIPGRMYFIRNVSDTETAVIYTSGGKRFFAKNTNVGSAPNGPISLFPNVPVANVYNNNTGSNTDVNQVATKSVILISDGFNWTYFN